MMALAAVIGESNPRHQIVIAEYGGDLSPEESKVLPCILIGREPWDKSPDEGLAHL